MKVSFFTLGCKLNQLETEAIAGAFSRSGCTVAEWSGAGGAENQPDILIINACTVTSKAEQKARRIIRAALRETAAVVVVTGCYAQLDPEKIAALGKETPGRLFVLPGGAKDALLDAPEKIAGGDPLPSVLGALSQASPPDAPSGPFRFAPDVFSFHSRAFLKIQDGCNRACAYCRVPLARGKSVSLEAVEVLSRLKKIEENGFAEVFITGVNIAQYRCPESGKDLGALLQFLLKGTKKIALRLSSIEPEPGLISGDFLEAAGAKRIRPHFHLSLQSGSDAVLKAMGRPYAADDIRETVNVLRKVKNDPFLACDVITGFPGETEDDFALTENLCRELDFAWIHGFPFSPRPGTAAFSLKNRVSERESARRLEILLELSRRGRAAYIERWIGKTVEAVPQGKALSFSRAVTDNYLKVCVKRGNSAKEGSCLCRLTGKGSDSFDVEGEIIVY